MAMRVLAGLALWLALAALPVLHVGARVSLLAFALLPLPLLFIHRAAVLFLLAFLPLWALNPDLISPRVHGTMGILGISGMFAGYLVLSLRDFAVPALRRTRLESPRRRVAALFVVAAAVLCSSAVVTPYLPPVGEAIRQGYPADPGAATVLLAIAVLALSSGLVLTYLASPLDEAARGRP